MSSLIYSGKSCISGHWNMARYESYSEGTGCNVVYFHLQSLRGRRSRLRRVDRIWLKDLANMKVLCSLRREIE